MLLHIPLSRVLLLSGLPSIFQAKPRLPSTLIKPCVVRVGGARTVSAASAGTNTAIMRSSLTDRQSWAQEGARVSLIAYFGSPAQTYEALPGNTAIQSHFLYVK